MAKHLIDSELFNDPDAAEWTPEQKLAYIYLNVECDYAGGLVLNRAIAELHLRVKVDWQTAFDAFNQGRERIRVAGNFIFLNEFMQTQYGIHWQTSKGPFQDKARALYQHHLDTLSTPCLHPVPPTPCPHPVDTLNTIQYKEYTLPGGAMPLPAPSGLMPLGIGLKPLNPGINDMDGKNAISRYTENGLSIIPIKPFTKEPFVPAWKEYQEAIVTPDISGAWGLPIAIICGAVSGGLVALDFDNNGGGRYAQFMEIVRELNPELAKLLVVEQTPSGGYHIIFRCPQSTIGIKKLARLEKPINGKSDLIQNIHEGGYFLCAPSPGYSLIQNDFLSIPVISLDEQELLIDCARSFDERYKESNTLYEKRMWNKKDRTLFDAYDKEHTPIELLVKHGWTIESKQGEVVYLKRPDKKGKGRSASWNFIKDRFWVFTDSDPKFQCGVLYKSYAVYTFLEHRGSFSKALEALRAKK